LSWLLCFRLRPAAAAAADGDDDDDDDGAMASSLILALYTICRSLSVSFFRICLSGNLILLGKDSVKSSRDWPRDK
jgi:hypothetical protein